MSAVARVADSSSSSTEANEAASVPSSESTSPHLQRERTATSIPFLTLVTDTTMATSSSSSVSSLSSSSSSLSPSDLSCSSSSSSSSSSSCSSSWFDSLCCYLPSSLLSYFPSPLSPDRRLSYFQHFTSSIFHYAFQCFPSSFPLPEHIAFIMDGNRRFGKYHHITSLNAHSLGYEKLINALDWAYSLGIKQVTVFAFSIENFKRSEEEQNYLMKMAINKFHKMCERADIIDRYGVRIRILGKKELLPKEVADAFIKACEYSKNNNKVQLNVAFAYTSTAELASSVTQISNGISNNCVDSTILDETFFQKCLWTFSIPLPDILIRTSGEKRLSDFFLEQIIGKSVNLIWVKKYWPDLTYWQVLACVVAWQIQQKKFKNEKIQSSEMREEKENAQQDQDEKRKKNEQFLKKVEEEYAF